MQRKCAAVLATVMLLATPVWSLAAITNDEVTSAKIREAVPGSTSQDTNSGSGIKTNHIVDTAVTTNKLADGAVTGAKLATGAVTSIHVAEGSVTSGKIADGAVTGAKIAAGAISDAHISGQIASTRLNIGTTSGTVAAGDHSHDELYQKKYAQVIVVAKSGGDFSDPASAINSITGATAETPYLVKIMPGVYDMGGGNVQMKSYVDVEGSGENNTIIKGAPPTPGNFSTLVNGADHAKLSNLTINNYGGVGAWVSHGLMAYGADIKVVNVTFIISGGVGHNEAIRTNGGYFENIRTFVDPSANNWGLVFEGSNATFKNVNFNNAKIDNRGSNLMLNDVTVGFILNESGPLILRNSVASAIQNNNTMDVAFSEITGDIYSWGTGKIAQSKISGTITGNPLSCFSVYNDTLAPVTCP